MRFANGAQDAGEAALHVAQERDLLAVADTENALTGSGHLSHSGGNAIQIAIDLQGEVGKGSRGAL
jgi:hypothetical protein